MQFLCGTPFLRELEDARLNYHNGKPVGDRIAIDEVEIAASISGHFSYNWSMWTIEDGKRESRVYHIYGFNPEPGYYRLKARRYTIVPVPQFQDYELIDILEKF